MANNLPNECKDLKPYLTKETARLALDPKTDFLLWIATAKTEAEKLHRLHKFTDVKLPITSKKASMSTQQGSKNKTLKLRLNLRKNGKI